MQPEAEAATTSGALNTGPAGMRAVELVVVVMGERSLACMIILHTPRPAEGVRNPAEEGLHDGVRSEVARGLTIEIVGGPTLMLKPGVWLRCRLACRRFGTSPRHSRSFGSSSDPSLVVYGTARSTSWLNARFLVAPPG